eukprot:Clim_evm97s207 gene=Clim_evmTU97s207
MSSSRVVQYLGGRRPVVRILRHQGRPTVRFMSTMETKHSEIAVVGGGIVGFTMAAMLGQAAMTKNLNIRVFDAGSPPKEWKRESNEFSNRTVSLNPKTQSLLNGLGVWAKLEDKRTKSYRRMTVWDSQSPGTLEFDAQNVGEDYIAHMVENDALVRSLFDVLADMPNVTIHFGEGLQELERGSKTTVARNFSTPKGRYSASLIIGADGAGSKTRQLAGFETIGWDYKQRANVATLDLDLSGCHADTGNETAWQRFHSTGPIAILPLTDTVSSMVWTTTPDMSQKLKELPPDELLHAINSSLHDPVDRMWPKRPAGTGTPHSFAPDVPIVTGVHDGSLASFPLAMMHSTQYIRQRLCLVGDAAHRVHPLAGQGVNLGIEDAQRVTESLESAIRSGQDFGGMDCLLAYESSRLVEIAPMLAAMDLLQKTFCNDNPALAILRGIGMSSFNQAGPIKEAIMKFAMA